MYNVNVAQLIASTSGSRDNSSTILPQPPPPPPPPPSSSLPPPSQQPSIVPLFPHATHIPMPLPLSLPLPLPLPPTTAPLFPIHPVISTAALLHQAMNNYFYQHLRPFNNGGVNSTIATSTTPAAATLASTMTTTAPTTTSNRNVENSTMTSILSNHDVATLNLTRTTTPNHGTTTPTSNYFHFQHPPQFNPFFAPPLAPLGMIPLKIHERICPVIKSSSIIPSPHQIKNQTTTPALSSPNSGILFASPPIAVPTLAHQRLTASFGDGHFDDSREGPPMKRFRSHFNRDGKTCPICGQRLERDQITEHFTSEMHRIKEMLCRLKSSITSKCETLNFVDIKIDATGENRTKILNNIRNRRNDRYQKKVQTAVAKQTMANDNCQEQISIVDDNSSIKSSTDQNDSSSSYSPRD